MSTTERVVIIGIDPGYDRIGWAIGAHTRSAKAIECDCIQTKKKQTIFERYSDLTQQLESIIQKHKPTEAAIETLFFSKNTKTAMRVSEARGVIISTLLRHGISIFEYGPTTIKSTVAGSGRADKRGVAKMVQLQLGLSKDLIDDALDAAACMLTHSILRDKQMLL